MERVWRALADPTRRALLDELAVRPRTTGELVAKVPELSRTGVMKHLDVLEAAGLLLIRREGRKRWNHLNPVPIQQVCERWINRHQAAVSRSMIGLARVAEESSDEGEGTAGGSCNPNQDRT